MYFNLTSISILNTRIFKLLLLLKCLYWRTCSQWVIFILP